MGVCFDLGAYIVFVLLTNVHRFWICAPYIAFGDPKGSPGVGPYLNPGASSMMMLIDIHPLAQVVCVRRTV